MHRPATSHQPLAPGSAGGWLAARHAQDLRSARRAFTLTELLVVIAIIAMLVALVSVGVMRAMGTAKQTRIKTEVDQLDAAFKAYKEKYGDYPPSDWLLDMPSVVQHVAKAFPRYNLGTNNVNLTNDLLAAGIDTNNFRPDQALVFWLRGFSNDPQHPFVTRDGYQIVGGTVPLDPTTMRPIVATRTSFFDFDVTRLAAVVNSTSSVRPMMPQYQYSLDWFSYFPVGSPTDSTGAPYLYWDRRSYGRAPMPPMYVDPLPKYKGFDSGPMPIGQTGTVFYTNAGIAVPYWSDANHNGTPDVVPLDNWINPDSFQIIAAGSDGKYGVSPVAALPRYYRVYPEGTNYDTSAGMADDDNVTNFCAKARLGDAKP